MGVLGSKESLGQIVVIYGYNSNDFAWRNFDSRSVYHTTGLIIKHQNKKYIVTTRQRLISCKNIVMYYCYFRGTEPVMRNDLQILFQSIEYNIVILGTKDCDEFDLTMSEIIYGDHDPKNICPSYDITKSSFVVPTKRSHFHTVRMDMDLESNTINYQVHIYDVKFMKSFIYDSSYVPNNYMYKFTFKNETEPKLYGICGAIIFNKKHQLVGMISMSEENELYVLPTKTLCKVVNDFVRFKDNPNQYKGIVSLPFNYALNNNHVEITDINTFVLDSPSGTSFASSSELSKRSSPSGTSKKIFRKNDKLISVGNFDIEVDDGINVYDKDFRENIPLEIFIALNFDCDKPLDITILRKKKIINMSLCSASTRDCLPLTNRSYFYPINSIPYVNLNGIIFVQITHELLDITMYRNILLSNNLLGKYFADENDNYNKILIIDCLNYEIAEKYKLPQLLLTSEKQKLECPFVTTINGKDVSNLIELQNIITSNTKDKKIIIRVGVSYTNQFDIIL
ncbi:hypothetical protein QJ856_gp0817 [Tupanvirus deep ocean]|uniref:Uncharacterized protein n=2 Tax=Tupanvirus TaxID=2094720 RepID=A0AC62A843_9VIRU|nr:hypothetical protein QJ856_gp0817 [Tupanvirus deep ocean]QKU33936.1 hypothetical protein [Tupanvirus deep ocean]